LELLLPFCAEIVLVLSPEGREIVESELPHLTPRKLRVTVQMSPTGMGDAVAAGMANVRTSHVVVLWGDQVAIRKASVEAALRLHEGPLEPEITCPTVFRSDPYIHFERDAFGLLCHVLQAREGDSMPEHGESDTGMFCFQTAVLLRLLREWRSNARTVGARTQEFNLLPLIPLAARALRPVLTPHIMSVEETLGINTQTDAMVVETLLARRLHG
jgi:bifunctional N-acetylglucosamine-1-phosphate-uridyltransferase/glucosamine-1-phosphate-acetyltransferase GlmU-like protein